MALQLFIASYIFSSGVLPVKSRAAKVLIEFKQRDSLFMGGLCRIPVVDTLSGTSADE